MPARDFPAQPKIIDLAECRDSCLVLAH
jgi:hypothetical protein